MSTKNDKYLFVEQSFTTSENRYYNLNLNQSEKCATLIPVQSDRTPNNDKYCVSGNYKENEKLQSLYKSYNFTTLNEDNNDLKKRCKNKNILNTTNKSILFLHIAPYENSTERAASNLFDDENIEGLKKEKLGSIKKRFFTDSLKLRNPFEFPRQQDGDQRNKPENMQFKASQKLLDSQPPSCIDGDPPSVPQQTEIKEDATPKSLITKDPNASVQREIHNLIQLLSNCIEDICDASFKMSYDRMEEYNQNLKKCLASIESDLSEQMNIMEESIMSTDFKCCSALYDREIEDMNEMLQQFNKIYYDKVLSKMNIPSS
uniref:Uncharacterized protein n=1 Tax=Panagrolaimus sp. PS1159 TaxID=55785 RepID=A0AC35GX43_9BILA